MIEKHIIKIVKDYQQTEKYKDYKKLYYINNRDNLNEKFTCECGKVFTLKHKNRHCQSKFHIEHLK